MKKHSTVWSQSLWLAVIGTLVSLVVTGSAAGRVRTQERERSQAPRRTAQLETAKTPGAIAAALPMRFEVNRGQTDGRVRFVARGGSYAVFLTDSGPVVS